jgi:hypothetical protein
MIELNHDTLMYSFPQMHPEACLTIDFQRTLRIPDDGKDYPLPPGLGRFPIRHVDDYSENVPPMWIRHGGVMLPMYQSEALWLNFSSAYLPDRGTAYPFAIKVATGKVNAVTGDNWSDGLNRSPQDYMVSTEQPWLDGYCVEKGFIRQFVAMPLGSGYTAEEQMTGKADHGGIQIVVYPMKWKVFEKRFPKRPIQKRLSRARFDSDICFSLAEPCADMGLAPGGRMRQEIYKDPFNLSDWDLDRKSRCFVHLANSLAWRAITGDPPPMTPFTSKEYAAHGLPWFDYYSDNSSPLDGADKLKGLKSIVEMGKQKGDNPLPENEGVDPEPIVKISKNIKKNQVREGRF